MNSLDETFFEVLKKCNIDKTFFNIKTNSLNVKELKCSNLSEEELKKLNIIETIEGDLIINLNDIKHISTFNNLKRVKNIVIQNMQNLEFITGFNVLEQMDSLLIDKNINLKEIFGFNQLFFRQKTVKGFIKITNNISLNGIEFLRGLKQVNSSFYLHHNSLKSLRGLEELEIVNASFSLSSNKLTSLKELKNLKIIDGMIGLVDNNLKTLEGLEHLEHLKTIKWNNILRTIAINGNKNLKDISALKNVVEFTHNCIVLIDSTQEFIEKPDFQSVFSNNNIIVFAQDIQKTLLKSKVCIPFVNDKSKYIDIREEFILDEHWRPNLKYLDYVFLRGREGRGTQLERIDLVKWQDKIYIYHFLKEHNIASMPILSYSNRFSDEFFEKIRNMYENGLKSFVLKVSHLANSNGIYRVKDGKFIGANDTIDKNEMYGKEVDFDYLKNEIKRNWNVKQTEEDWSSMMVNPGVILEELIEDSVELKFSIVFGEVAGFFIRTKGFPSFDADGNLLSKNIKTTLPFWWKDARSLALKVSKLVKADHIRIDVFYHKNQVLINEITWNGGERSEFSSIIAQKLNEGYSKRLKMLNKKFVDSENDDFVQIILNQNEYFNLATNSVLNNGFSARECKFIIVDVNSNNPKFYWMNTKKHKYHYMFFKNILKRDCDMSTFDSISYSDENRQNIVGSLVFHENGIEKDGKKMFYAINFWPSDSIRFEQIAFTFNLIKQKAYFISNNNCFLHVVSELQECTIKEQNEEFKKSNICSIDSQTLMKNIDFLPMNKGLSYGILRFSSDTTNYNVKDIVVLNELPNHLSHVSGIITNLPQTPLSHINLLAKQNKIPNCYLKDASLKEQLLSLKNKYVKFEVDSFGYKISKAKASDVEKYFEKIRPKNYLEPIVNLDTKEIRLLKNINNVDYNSYGTKASNLGELYNILNSDNLSNGFAIPFYFYDEFMKFNDFYKDIEILNQEYISNEKSSFKYNLLKDFRKKIRNALIPSWMEEEFSKILEYYPKETYLRCRSSTNNEDLEDFSGAGLYDSYSYKDFTLPLSYAIKKVWASIWNYRAYEERGFYKIIHSKTMMGVVVYPRYKGELANGVAVTKNIFNERKKGFYINVQANEALVTNPNSLSIPEEIVVIEAENRVDYVFQYIRYSNLTEDKQKVLNENQLNELLKTLELIDEHFKKVYIKRNGKNIAMEIEFKFTQNGKLHIKQVRPWIEC